MEMREIEIGETNGIERRGTNERARNSLFLSNLGNVTKEIGHLGYTCTYGEREREAHGNGVVFSFLFYPEEHFPIRGKPFHRDKSRFQPSCASTRKR